MRKIMVLAALVLTALSVGAEVAPAKQALSCRVGVYVSAKWYSGTVLRSDHTSCPFAQNVLRASLRYVVEAGGEGDGDFYTSAYSPVTLKNYRVHCFAHGNLWTFGMNVDCRAGIGARVIYRAHSGR